MATLPLAVGLALAAAIGLWSLHWREPDRWPRLLMIVGFALCASAIVSGGVGKLLDTSGRPGSTWSGRVVAPTRLARVEWSLPVQDELPASSVVLGQEPRVTDSTGRLRVWLADGTEGAVPASAVQVDSSGPRPHELTRLFACGLVLYVLGVAVRTLDRCRRRRVRGRCGY